MASSNTKTNSRTKTSSASPPRLSPQERIDFARQAFAGSLFVFAKECLGYDKLYDVHRPWCSRAENLLHGYLRRDEAYTQRAMTLEPRGTFKSTILTVAFALWALIHEPNLRILIYSASATNAENFLHEIKQQVTTNEKFRACFGAWEANSPVWTSTAIHIASRTKQKKEASLAAVGRGSEMTSMHFDIALVDDIVTREDRDSASTRQASKSALKDLEAIMEPESLVHIIGTHWHYDDAYAWIRNTLNRELAENDKQGWDVIVGDVYNEDGVTCRFERIIPDIEALKYKRGMVEFWANYRNNPLPPDTQLFGEEDLTFFRFDQNAYDGQRKVSFWDPASSQPVKGKDPDYHAIPVLAQHPDGTYDVIDVWMKQEKPTAGYAMCERFARDYDLDELRVETNHLPDAADNLEARFRRKGIRTAVSGIKAKTSKAARIETLEPLTSAGRIRFREDWRSASASYRIFMEQLMMYPVASHDDAPDALEGAYSMIFKGAAAPFIYEGGRLPGDQGEEDFDGETLFPDYALENIDILFNQ